MAKISSIQTEEKSQKKFDGKMIIDQFLFLDRICNRLAAIIDGHDNVDCGNNNEAWRGILESELKQAHDDLSELRGEILEGFAIVEYITKIKNEHEFAAESEMDD